MYGLKRLNSLFTSSKPFLRRCTPLRSYEHNATITYKRKVLPPELSRGVLKLKCESSADGGVCDVFVVGTFHESEEYCQKVQSLIEFLKPEVVFVELCDKRACYLVPHKFKRPTMGEMVDTLKENGIVLRTLFTCSGVFAEITIRRTWAKMPLWHKIKLSSNVVFYVVFLPIIATLSNCNWLKEMDVDDRINLAIKGMMRRNKITALRETFIHERDQYMSAKLLDVAREHTSVVAVVGKAHLPGIKKNWKQPIEVEQLLSIPSKTNTILSCVGASVAGLAFIYGIYLSIKK